MSKQLTKEEIFNAKRIHLYNDEVIYMEMEESWSVMYNEFVASDATTIFQ